MQHIKSILLALSFLFLLFSSCSKKGIGNLLEPKSPYEKYVQKLKESDIEKTALGQDWINAGEKALRDSILIELPFKEVGYFPETKVSALGYQFMARRGEVIAVDTEWESRQVSKVFIDLFEQNPANNSLDVVTSADSTGRINYEVKEDKIFMVRLQPELLRGGKYTLTIKKESAYAFPIPGRDSKTVGSFFGMDRDGGRRKHEGIDIFVPKRTPVVAITDGRITGVRENRLGGKVVFLTDNKRNFNLYFAHLDSQIVTVGKRVEVGDTLGLVGNTGNAKFTPPHLHFGIYSWGYGAIDPFPFVAKSESDYPKITGSFSFLNISGKTKGKKTNIYNSPSKIDKPLTFLPKNTLLTVMALSGDYYKVLLPDGSQGYIKQREVITARPFHTASTRKIINVFDHPDISSSIIMDSIQVGTKIDIIGQFKGYFWVSYQNKQGWINQVL